MTLVTFFFFFKFQVDLGIEESLKVIEVQVESRSLVAVCGLHHAILHRIQVFKCFYYIKI